MFLPPSPFPCSALPAALSAALLRLHPGRYGSSRQPQEERNVPSAVLLEEQNRRKRSEIASLKIEPEAPFPLSPSFFLLSCCSSLVEPMECREV